MKLFSALWIIAFCAIHAVGNAQPLKSKAQLTKNSVIKDSTGMIYPENVWRSLLSTGHYKLRPVDPSDENSSFILITMSEEEYRYRIENAPKPRESKFFQTGQTISNFKATDIDGGKYKLKDLRGKVVVINFWFIDCLPCQKEIHELNKVVADYKDSSNVVFLAVCLDEEGRIRKSIAEKPFDYHIIENGRVITGIYGITVYPTNLVLDKNGKVVFHSSGFNVAVAPWIRKSIAAALEEQPTTATKTKQ